MQRLQGSTTSSNFRKINNRNKANYLNNNSNKSINNSFRSMNVYKSPFLNENSKEQRENTFYRVYKIPPIYFYRKINTPYKYNISSVPEYLIKANEEKHFIKKLYQSISNEKDKKTFNELIQKNNQLDSTYDCYKPKYLNVTKILKYRPELFNQSFKSEQRSKSELPKKFLSFRKPEVHNLNKIIETNEESTNDNNKISNINNKNEIKNNDKKIQNISKAAQVRYNHSLSDIFNIRNEKIFLNKSAERYLFREKEKENEKLPNFYNSGSDSQSDWIAKPSVIKMNTFSSVKYNILNPLCKGANKFISASEFNKNNKYNESPAYHRVKSISDFVDVTQGSAGNSLNCFNKKLNNKIPDFRLRDNVASNHLNAYHINKDIIQKPI